MPTEQAIPLLIIAFAVILYLTCKHYFGTPKAVKKWDEDVESYRSILRKLPKYLVEDFFHAIYNTGMSMGLPSKDLPDELTKAVSAATKVREAKDFGRLSKEKAANVSDAINQFEMEMEELIPIGRKALNQASNSGGLGFGLITNSAADAALYQAMDYHDKVKHYKKMNYTVNQMVDKEVAILMNAIVDAIK